MSLPVHCMHEGCTETVPATGRKWCAQHLPEPTKKTAKLQAQIEAQAAKLTRAGDRIQELEALLNERNAELTEARLLTEMLVGADRQWRQRERLLEMELERLRGDRGLHG